jgi:hypothetical protein
MKNLMARKLAHEINNEILATGAYAFHWRRWEGVLTYERRATG